MKFGSASRYLFDRLASLSRERLQLGSFGLRSQLFDLVGPVLEELRRDREQDNALTESGKHVQAVLEEMDCADLQKVSVGALAYRCGCSRRHINRLIHEQFGCSVTALKTRVRLDKAASLMRSPEAKVTNVALECGFAHLGSFTAMFKKRFGATPARWRRTVLAQGQANVAPASLRSAPRSPVQLRVPVPPLGPMERTLVPA